MTEPGHIHNIGFLKLGYGNLASERIYVSA